MESIIVNPDASCPKCFFPIQVTLLFVLHITIWHHHKFLHCCCRPHLFLLHLLTSRKARTKTSPKEYYQASIKFLLNLSRLVSEVIEGEAHTH
ncbi:hypothetical protein RJT34_26040 [Clitoria ternatea]|uniref:Uncharacterized protein n=1 Tax=Clitoria ternatea TaxID=43366 RepID=A0AAN9F8S8_CLITE